MEFVSVSSHFRINIWSGRLVNDDLAEDMSVMLSPLEASILVNEP